MIPALARHGFDVLDFGTSAAWLRVRDQCGLEYEGFTRFVRFLDQPPPYVQAFAWSSHYGLRVWAQNNPETGEYAGLGAARGTQHGFASHVGVEGHPELVSRFVVLVRECASFKGESPGRRAYI